MFADTVIISSKEHIESNLKSLIEMMQKEIGSGLSHNIKTIVKESYLDKNGDQILRVTVEWKLDESII